jgi:hypothetical protein
MFQARRATRGPFDLFRLEPWVIFREKGGQSPLFFLS